MTSDLHSFSLDIRSDTQIMLDKCVMRMRQVGEGDSALLPRQLDHLRTTLKHLFWDGAIWLPEAEGTITHDVLKVMRGTTNFFHGDKESGDVLH